MILEIIGLKNRKAARYSYGLSLIKCRAFALKAIL
jgi:hypothetical protein